MGRLPHPLQLGNVRRLPALCPYALDLRHSPGGRIRNVNWRTFAPSNFEYDFENDKLLQHRVTFNEAVECFFSDFEVRRNKKYRDRYQLLGTTFGGRPLKIIFQLKSNNVVRIVTGWPL